MIDAIDRDLINGLHGGFPICERPFAEVAERFGLTEADVMARVEQLLETGALTRFGPLFDAEKLGGGLTLAALAVPDDRFEEVADIVNGFPEVAHNYARTHTLNMWFVVATERPEQVAQVLGAIEKKTGLPVLDMPKEREFFLELRLQA